MSPATSSAALISAAVADGLGLAWNFYFFAALNLAGAALVYFTIRRVQPMHAMTPAGPPLVAMIAHWRNPRLRAAYGIGFCILFAFIGTFTFVNFVLVRPPLSLGMMDLGLVYFVFLPSVVTTSLAGRVASRLGTRPTIWGSLAVAGLGLPLMLAPHLGEVLIGMVLVGVGTFFAQGRRDRLRRTGRHRQPRRRQRNLSCLLLLRRADRHGRARATVRQFRLARLRRRCRRGPRGRGHAHIRPEALALDRRFLRRLVIGDRAPRRPVEIVVLAAPERPEEGDETGASEHQRQRNQDDQDFHHTISREPLRARSEFSMTRIDDPLMAAAAIRGVTTPLIATGTARTL
ncbi:hypothetical protein ACVIQT_004043 [Bradyrhizobium diazoefficiens]